MIRRDADLARKFEHLIAMPGIAETSVVHLLGEPAGLDPEMTVRLWVAHSGLKGKDKAKAEADSLRE